MVQKTDGGTGGACREAVRQVGVQAAGGICHEECQEGGWRCVAKR